MEGGIEWLGFWPLFHAAALLTGWNGIACGWLVFLLLAAVLGGCCGLMLDLCGRYEWKGLPTD